MHAFIVIQLTTIMTKQNLKLKRIQDWGGFYTSLEVDQEPWWLI